MNGKLAKHFCRKELPLQVCKSYAGFYIGTMEHEEPFTRESMEYFTTHEEAQHALDTGEWSQKQSL